MAWIALLLGFLFRFCAVVGAAVAGYDAVRLIWPVKPVVAVITASLFVAAGFALAAEMGRFIAFIAERDA